MPRPYGDRQNSTLETRQWRERRIIEVVEVATNPTGWNAGDWGADDKPASWLAEAQEELALLNLPNLMASLHTLGSQLSALQTALQHSGVLPLRQDGPVALYSDGPVEFRASKAQEDAVVKVSLLGPFQIFAGGRSLGPSIPRQVRTVLEYLLSQGRRPTSKDALLDLLWPDTNPTVACSRLRVVMHTLRKSIPCAGLGFQ